MILLLLAILADPLPYEVTRKDGEFYIRERQP